MGEGGDAATQDTCTPTCGDGVLKGAENCDDGNTADDDGCSAKCLVEESYFCAAAGSACAACTCGDGKRSCSEDCDDANTANGDGCDSQCQVDTNYHCTGG